MFLLNYLNMCVKLLCLNRVIPNVPAAVCEVANVCEVNFCGCVMYSRGGDLSIFAILSFVLC